MSSVSISIIFNIYIYIYIYLSNIMAMNNVAILNF